MRSQLEDNIEYLDDIHRRYRRFTHNLLLKYTHYLRIKTQLFGTNINVIHEYWTPKDSIRSAIVLVLVPLHLTRDESASVQCGSGASRVVKNFKGEKIFDICSWSLLCWFSLLLDPVAGEWVWWWRLGGGVWVLGSPVVVVVDSRVGCRGWGRVGCWWWTGSGLISGRNGPPTLVGCCKKKISWITFKRS